MAQRWWPATGRSEGDPGRAAVTGWLWAYPGSSLDVEPVGQRPLVVVRYRSVAVPRLDAWTDAAVQQLGPGTCSSVPVHGFGIVRCR
jgi:hypothetical protein